MDGLDIMSQLPLLKGYNQFVLCFPVPNGTSREYIVKALEAAAIKLATAFPWLAGKVIHEGSCAGDSGRFELAPCPSFAPPNTLVRVKDCSDLCPTYAEYIEARGPVTMFDGDIVAPYRGFPESYEESKSEPRPVIALQANFIKHGLLLDFAAHHNVMDGSALFQFMRLLSKAMREEPFSDIEIQQGNRDRRNLVPLLGPNEQLLDHSGFIRPPISEILKSPPKPRSGTWTSFRFSAQKQTELKALASKPEGFDLAVPFITTNDALSAFIWQRVSTARLRRLQSPDMTSKFTRAVDARIPMKLPREYMGQMVYDVFSRMSMSDLVMSPLPAVATLMRKDLNSDNNEHAVRSFVTLINNKLDKSTIMYGGVLNPDTDIGFSSVAQADLYAMVFGTLGKPKLVRRPTFAPMQGLIYLWPKTDAGDVDALMCLDSADIQALKDDQEWISYADYIG